MAYLLEEVFQHDFVELAVVRHVLCICIRSLRALHPDRDGFGADRQGHTADREALATLPPSVLDGSPPLPYLAFSSANLSAKCHRALLSLTLPSIPLTARVRGICEPSAFRLPQSFWPHFTAFSCTYVKRAVMWSWALSGPSAPGWCVLFLNITDCSCTVVRCFQG